MKILIVSSVPTHPVSAGNRKAILNLVDLLKSMGHFVKFLFIDEKPLLSSKDNNYCELQKYWGSGLIVFPVSSFEHIIHLIKQRFRRIFQRGITKVDDYYPFGLSCFLKHLQEKERFDCCIVNYYFLSKALMQKDIPLTGLYTHDYFAYKSMLVGNKKVGYGTDSNQEAIAMQRAKHIFALNTEEAIYFSKLSPKSSVYNVFNTFEMVKTNYVGNKNLLFFSGDNQYNINGLMWFLENIFTEIIRADSDIKLLIGGGICKVLKNINTQNIELIGYVKDPLEFYMRGDVVINPTYQGTGLKIKTFEAIAYGKVVLAHPHSVAGIYDPTNAPVFASEDTNEWLSFIKLVLCNKHEILKIKMKDESYIKNMNKYVTCQFEKFFDNLKNI